MSTSTIMETWVSPSPARDGGCRVSWRRVMLVWVENSLTPGNRRQLGAIWDNIHVQRGKQEKQELSCLLSEGQAPCGAVTGAEKPSGPIATLVCDPGHATSDI